MDHPDTGLIAVYCEDFGDGRAFVAAATAAAEAGKPVLLLTVGGSQASMRGAKSHTGALTSDTAVIDAACHAAGTYRVASPRQVAGTAATLLSYGRHAVHRVAAATPLAVLFGVPGGILGMVSPTLGGIVGGAGKVLSGLTLAPYSREQETEVDRIGIGFAARAGWDPTALAGFLGSLERAEAQAGATTKKSSFFATHPSTPDRVTHIESAARTR